MFVGGWRAELRARNHPPSKSDIIFYVIGYGAMGQYDPFFFCKHNVLLVGAARPRTQPRTVV